MPENDILQQALDVVEQKAIGFRNLRAKGVGFTLAQLTLAEIMTKRIAKLGSTVMQLEDKVFKDLETLTPEQIVNLYQMSSKALMHATDYVQKVTNTVDWADLEAQLVALSEDKGGKIDLDVSKGAELLLKRLSYLRTTKEGEVSVPDNVVEAFKNTFVMDDIKKSPKTKPKPIKTKPKKKLTRRS